jgi:hypothetical protein
LNTPGEKTTAAIGKDTDEHGERVTELCGLEVTPHQKYLLSITANTRASDADLQWHTRTLLWLGEKGYGGVVLGGRRVLQFNIFTGRRKQLQGYFKCLVGSAAENKRQDNHVRLTSW